MLKGTLKLTCDDGPVEFAVQGETPIQLLADFERAWLNYQPGGILTDDEAFNANEFLDAIADGKPYKREDFSTPEDNWTFTPGFPRTTVPVQHRPKRTYLTEFSAENHPSEDIVRRIMQVPTAKDVSWHNDVAPSWNKSTPEDPYGEHGIRFMVHPEKPEDREDAQYPRFDVFREGRGDSLYSGDDFEAALKVFTETPPTE